MYISQLTMQEKLKNIFWLKRFDYARVNRYIVDKVYVTIFPYRKNIIFYYLYVEQNHRQHYENGELST